jgi:hypothetical protein
VQVSRHAPGSRFVTMVVGLYDPDSGGLVYVNAGQNPPLLRRASGAFERLTEGGMALGMFDQSVYTTGRLTLDPGDVLVLYSDGVTEAENMSGVAFDEGGLQIVIGQHWWQDLNTLGTSSCERGGACRRRKNRRRSHGPGRPPPRTSAPRTGLKPNLRSAITSPGASNHRA